MQEIPASEASPSITLLTNKQNSANQSSIPVCSSTRRSPQWHQRKRQAMQQSQETIVPQEVPVTPEPIVYTPILQTQYVSVQEPSDPVILELDQLQALASWPRRSGTVGVPSSSRLAILNLGITDIKKAIYPWGKVNKLSG